MRIIFMGSPEFSVATLKELHKKHEVCAVYTQPPKPAHRGHKITKSAIHQAAEDMGLNVYTPKSLRKHEAQQEFAAHQADIAIVVAYGLILPKEILEAPIRGCINIHASLLPRWRGAAPIQRAIEAGDEQTGITYMQMDEGLDTGDELLKITLPIQANETGGSLHDKLSAIGAENINKLLAKLDNIHPQKQQQEGVTYAHKLSRKESKVNWNDTATTIERRLRAFNPWPGTFCEYQQVRLRILEAHMEEVVHNQKVGSLLDDRLLVACGQNALRITKLQKAGKKPMLANDFLRGNAISTGDYFI
ncbi:MAG: methionyl-tRNA formyltransferase [Alphaproteobacteria bacterium]